MVSLNASGTPPPSYIGEEAIPKSNSASSLESVGSNKDDYTTVVADVTQGPQNFAGTFNGQADTDQEIPCTTKFVRVVKGLYNTDNMLIFSVAMGVITLVGVIVAVTGRGVEHKAECYESNSESLFGTPTSQHCNKTSVTTCQTQCIGGTVTASVAFIMFCFSGILYCYKLSKI